MILSLTFAESVFSLPSVEECWRIINRGEPTKVKAFSPCSLLTQVLGEELPILSILSIVMRPSTFILTLSITIVYLCKESTNRDSKVLHKDCCLLSVSVLTHLLPWLT